MKEPKSELDTEFDRQLQVERGAELDQDFVDDSDEAELAEDAEAYAELSGLEGEAATLADSELEDEANLPMEGQDVRLEDALPFSDSDGDAGYGRDE